MALSCPQTSSDHDCPCVTVVGRSLSHADRTPCLCAPGSRPLRPDPNLQIRRFLYRRPAPFRTVHDLGLVSSGCPGGSGAPEGCSFAWLPADDSVTPWSSSPSPGLFPATRPCRTRPHTTPMSAGPGICPVTDRTCGGWPRTLVRLAAWPLVSGQSASGGSMSRVAEGHFRWKREALLILRGSTS